jgi:predicted phosphodiesterase
VLSYLDKYPDTPSLTLAKIIAREHPVDFPAAESARNVIRYYRGYTGEKNRRRQSKGVTGRHIGGGKRPYIPADESVDYLPLVLREQDNNIGIISDLHFPNHRARPIELALDKFDELKVNVIAINGDLLDNTPFTRFDRAPINPADVPRVFNMVERFLEELRDRYPKARIIWLEGNHDAWYTKFLMKRAEVLFGDTYFHLPERLHLDEYKIEYLPQERFMMAGKLAIMHGHHVIKGMFTPVNAARGVYLRAKVNALIGHVHVASYHEEKDLHGDVVGCWSTGCLCTLTPDYQPMAGKASHGFAHVKVDKNGGFHVENYRIHKGKIL